MAILKNFKKRLKMRDNTRQKTRLVDKIAAKASTDQVLNVVRRSRWSLPSSHDWLCFLAPLLRRSMGRIISIACYFAIDRSSE